jgi:hypothetical protein
MATPTKKWYQSKTLWLSATTVAIGILSFVQGQIETGATITAIGILNAALRIITTQAIK